MLALIVTWDRINSQIKQQRERSLKIGSHKKCSILSSARLAKLRTWLREGIRFDSPTEPTWLHT